MKSQDSDYDSHHFDWPFLEELGGNKKRCDGCQLVDVFFNELPFHHKPITICQCDQCRLTADIELI